MEYLKAIQFERGGEKTEIKTGDLVELNLKKDCYEYGIDVHRRGFKVVSRDTLLEPEACFRYLRRIPLVKRMGVLDGTIRGNEYTDRQREYAKYLDSLELRRVPDLIAGYVSEIFPSEQIILRDGLILECAESDEQYATVPSGSGGIVAACIKSRIVSLKDTESLTVLKSRNFKG